MDHVKGAFGSLLPKVVELFNLVDCKMQIDSLEPDWESLKRELVDLQNKLEYMNTESGYIDGYIDADLSKSPSSQLAAVKVWAEVRELSYDLEDGIDNFRVCLEGSEPLPDIDLLKNLVQEMTYLPLWKGNTEDMKVPMDAMIEDVAARPASTTTIDPRVEAMYTEVSHLVGMSGNMDRLIAMIKHAWEDGSQYEDTRMPSKYRPKIACVVGFGGLGKTTLVRALYNNIIKDFSCNAFVSVGQNANARKVLIDILLAVDKEKKEKNYTTYGLERRDDAWLLKELKEFISNKRYLIVIDDIWKKTLWEFIKYAFGDECHFGSTVFTTTRIIDVANACCSPSNGHLIYEMKPLSDEYAKCLFYRRVFSQAGGECRDGFEQVSAAILKKCGGVPLAIITLASLLSGNGEGIKELDEWIHVLNSIGRGLTEDQSVKEMNRILSLSYDDLHPDLKSCLLYIVVFPEDYMIRKDCLVALWIAEGLVQRKKRTDMEGSLFEIAENYFNMLINRSMIEAVDINGEGKVEACRVHDMVLGLLCSLSSEANFVTLLDANTRTISNSETKVRRLSVQDRNVTPVVAAHLSAGSMGMSHVRSFTLWSYRFDNPVSNLVPPPLSSFHFLRVLHLGNCYLGSSFHQTNPWYIKSLLHLRYLDLSYTKIDVLPTDIGKLKFLQILDLGGNYIEELPSSIVELRQLVRLRIEPETRLPDEFGKLTSLEELTHVKVNHDSAYVAKQLGFLSRLRVLEITPDDMHESLAEDFVDSLNKLLEIRILKVRGAHVSTDVKYINNLGENWKPSSHLQKFWAGDNSCFRELPKWITESSNICCLHIWLKKVRREDFEVLGRLQYLRYLSLIQEDTHEFYQAEQEEDFEFENDLFPVLREYHVEGFVTLPSMFPKGAMPKVQSLKFDVKLQDFERN